MLETKTCEQCGKKFQAETWRKQKFCSRDCWYAYDRKIRQSNPLSLICESCGKPFKKYPGTHNLKAKHHFCCKRCAHEWRLDNNGYPSSKEHPEYNSIKVDCSYCGRELTRQPYRLRSNPLQFCDKECFRYWRSENIHGKAHPRWRGGRLPDYGPEWYRIAEKARKRDGYRCRCCNVTQEEIGKLLDVHHVVPFRRFAYRRGENQNHLVAHRLDNLITLCPHCHKKIEAGHINLPT